MSSSLLFRSSFGEPSGSELSGGLFESTWRGRLSDGISWLVVCLFVLKEILCVVESFVRRFTDECSSCFWIYAFGFFRSHIDVWIRLRHTLNHLALNWLQNIQNFIVISWDDFTKYFFELLKFLKLTYLSLLLLLWTSTKSPCFGKLRRGSLPLRQLNWFLNHSLRDISFG